MPKSANNDYSINAYNVRSAFNLASGVYDAFSMLQRTVTDRLMESFDYIKIDPASILELGSGTGYGSRKLKKRFRKAHVFQCDISDGMLKAARKQSTLFFSKNHFLCANASQLSLHDSCFELVFSSLMLQWCNDLDVVFAEISRILKPGGVFVFTGLGLDTLKELRQSWAKVDDHVHANAFIDIHDVGDALVRNNLQAPVLSMEHIVLTYDNCRQLMQELKGTGAHNINNGRRKTLTGKTRLGKMMKHYELYRQDNKLPATYEVIYGHAWQPDQHIATGNMQTVSIKNLKKNFKY